MKTWDSLKQTAHPGRLTFTMRNLQQKLKKYLKIYCRLWYVLECVIYPLLKMFKTRIKKLFLLERFYFSSMVDIICNKNANFVCFPNVFALSILLSGATEFN